jgi:hypothetical protein
MTGFNVSQSALETDATTLAGLVGSVAEARTKLDGDGQLPTLDVISTIMQDIGVMESGLALPFGMGAIVAGVQALKALGQEISASIDPYPYIRDTWLGALASYETMVRTDADTLRATAKQYSDTEQAISKGFQEIAPAPPPVTPQATDAATVHIGGTPQGEPWRR